MLKHKKELDALDIPYPKFGTHRILQKQVFPTLGARKNEKNRRSQLWEHPKIIKINVPKVGNDEKQQKQGFPKLGTAFSTAGSLVYDLITNLIHNTMVLKRFIAISSRTS